jgi:hypothetical protein
MEVGSRSFSCFSSSVVFIYGQAQTDSDLLFVSFFFANHQCLPRSIIFFSYSLKMTDDEILVDLENFNDAMVHFKEAVDDKGHYFIH